MQHYSFVLRSMRSLLVAFGVVGIVVLGVLLQSSPVVASEDVETATATEAATAATTQDEFIESMGGVYVRSANIVVIDEDRDQDALVVGSSVTLKSSVHDLFAAGTDVVVDGTVNGSLRAAGNTVTINGTVKGNVMVFASTVRIGKDAVIEGHVNVYGATVLMEGAAKKAFEARGESVSILGSIEGETYVEATTVLFEESATVGAGLYVEGPNAPVVKNAALDERLVYTQKALDGSQREEPSAIEMLQAQAFSALYWFIALSFIGILVLLLWGDRAQSMVRELNNSPMTALLKGIVFVCAVPVFVVLSAITIVGIPFALFILGAYVAVLALSAVAVGAWLGSKLLPGQSDEGSRGIVLQFLVGFALLTVVGATPFVGWIVNIFALLFGAGAIVSGAFTPLKK